MMSLRSARLNNLAQKITCFFWHRRRLRLAFICNSPCDFALSGHGNLPSTIMMSTVDIVARILFTSISVGYLWIQISQCGAAAALDQESMELGMRYFAGFLQWSCSAWRDRTRKLRPWSQNDNFGVRPRETCPKESHIKSNWKFLPHFRRCRTNGPWAWATPGSCMGAFSDVNKSNEHVGNILSIPIVIKR